MATTKDVLEHHLQCFGRGFNDRFLRFSLEGAEKDLAAVDADLARAARFPDLTMELCLACS